MYKKNIFHLKTTHAYVKDELAYITSGTDIFICTKHYIISRFSTWVDSPLWTIFFSTWHKLVLTVIKTPTYLERLSWDKWNFKRRNMMDFHRNGNLDSLTSKDCTQDMVKDPSPSKEPSHPPKVQQSVIFLQENSSNMTDFYETRNLSFLSWKDCIQNMIKNH